MNKNLHLKLGGAKILAITILTISILGGCSSTTKGGPVLPYVASESSNLIVPEGELRASHGDEIISKAYDSDNKYYEFVSNYTKPFLEKLDSIDKLTSDIPYFENSKGKSFSQTANSKSKDLMYVRELPKGNTTNSLIKFSSGLGFNEAEKPLLGQITSTLALIDNNNSGNIILSDKEKSILTIICPNLDLAEIQSNLSTVYEETLTNKSDTVTKKGKSIINIDDNTYVSTTTYKEEGSEQIIVNLAVIQTSQYKK